jgi:hypothetical protein
MLANPRPNLIWLLALVPYFMVVLGLVLGTWFSYWKSEITLMDRRLVFHTGFLSRRSGELPLENVESIYISEPLLGRVCGYGTVCEGSPEWPHSVSSSNPLVPSGACSPTSKPSRIRSWHAGLQHRNTAAAR